MLIRFTPVILLIASVFANTEKAIFTGPPAANIPSAHPTLEDLHVDILTPINWSIRTHLESQFPNISSPNGKATWLILDELTEGQRYEVRVCWAATQPTQFKITTYELQTVFETPELISELSEYSWARQSLGGNHGSQSKPEENLRISNSEREASVLFLQILAAADYFTLNKTLMRHVPPVHVDIILDPFLLGVLPRSLLPTVGYITAVAVTSWFIARYISMWIYNLGAEATPEKKIQ
ncbi:uncharacterized protein GGS22DRAFT_46866 [Annulohypoxylon maeteangense]|uniref:uncharacterized protein n=1 Tax=Annulohypoxylon maeteangense TaxID=1927788 RepID=UPI002008BD20|nr:uncharacterized protein GGS22DRAFT_46866 [Annulohypoxylon maeteangense]KAI0882605.1 hypothetical protein GGS22DRAFT_46866 [Annulohypoxylon maeteangense]